LLYHWLWNNRSKQFTDYQKGLSDGNDPSVSWRAAFADFDPAKPEALGKLDEALQRYGRSARYAFYTVGAQGEAVFAEAPLPPADIHVLLLQTRRNSGNEQVADARIRAELDEALREDPAQPVAIAWRAQLDQTSPLPALRKAITVRPRDWRAWLLLGQSLSEATEKAEKEAAYRKALELNPDSAAAQNALSWLLTKDGRTKEALPFANRAVDLAPWDPYVIDTLAAVAADLGKCHEALALQRRTVDMLMPNDRAGDNLRRRLQDSIKDNWRLQLTTCFQRWHFPREYL
jgi:Flp pilus assembly protein TadD